ncbi:hypothetical protein [Archangium lipolyticum]|uniref:hypothetical protein n=1 Tax=Archangium lipolyticum TaxID=2970465 RepID=UPI00214A7CFD|nr:hypothetical protein [Archangium lipolyticum]
MEGTRARQPSLGDGGGKRGPVEAPGRGSRASGAVERTGARWRRQGTAAEPRAVERISGAVEAPGHGSRSSGAVEPPATRQPSLGPVARTSGAVEDHQGGAAEART